MHLIFINQEASLFYGWWQFAACLFAFMALLSIWWHIGKKQNDFGQVWLAVSILCWSLSGLVEVYFVNSGQENLILADGFRSILSLFNSLFILLALPWFRYLPGFLKNIIKSKYWVFIVGLPFLFSLLPTLNTMISGREGVINELDVYYAVLTLLFLGFVLWHSFAKRRLMTLAYLSLVCIIITLLAQFYKLTGSAVNLTLFSAIFKTWLIMMFFALALSWVKELSENIISDAASLRIALKTIKKDSKIERWVFLEGLPGRLKSEVKLSNASFELLKRFAESRKLSPESWLEIKPKHHAIKERAYDINDYNEVKRLLIALVDGLFGKGNWTNEHHLLPLKNTLFELSEKRERKIRLSIPPDNITL
ncbi:hypothetical protein MTsPCn9_02170 [Croceitalea sp. MTPC9]|uniref:hypothetical protein n=1 Tax=unclassified Croceitalea TaxID=2632280 RepID=UPI002B39516D|nr:hypothetical protein MTsPCn6_06540 [Croceitalea sp. MTPC6]GMN15281.1 hypothetical protein MTsPCn9_02170 [Croceitalea sp. MTPC9]